MDKYVRAYFYTENDAESAKAELQKYNIHEDMVEPFQEDSGIHLRDILNLLTDKERITHMLHFHVDDKHITDVTETIKAHDGQIGEK